MITTWLGASKTRTVLYRVLGIPPRQKCDCMTSSGLGLSAALGTQDQESLVSATPDKAQAAPRLDVLTATADRAALAQYGIRIVDVRIKRLNLPEQNKQSVFARMRAERERIALQYRAEGEQQALTIHASADRQKEEIISSAYKDAEKVRGKGDAEATRIYGQAYRRIPSSTSCCARSIRTRRFWMTRPRLFSALTRSC